MKLVLLLTMFAAPALAKPDRYHFERPARVDRPRAERPSSERTRNERPAKEQRSNDKDHSDDR